MNAARRRIASDLRHRGLTGKEAYEATKRKEFISEWKKVQWVSGMMTVFDGRPKHRVTRENVVTWISKLIAKRLKDSLERKKANAEEATRLYEQRRKIAREMQALKRRNTVSQSESV